MASVAAFAQPTIQVFPSPAPNVFGSPSWPPYVVNALTALENGQSSIGNPATDPRAYYQVTQLNDRQNIVTPFPSWLGFANPGTTFGPAFAAELGNRVHFGVHILGNGTKFSLSQLSFDMESTDPGDIFQFVGDFSVSSYSSTRIGINYGLDGKKGTPDDVLITAGPGTQLVDELVYVGVGNALAPADVGCPAGTDQEMLDCAKAFYDTLIPFSLTTTYALTNGVGGTLATGAATVVFSDLPPSIGTYQIDYLPSAGTGIAAGYIDISNNGSLGADAFGPLAGTTGRICVNVYTFTADEQESECCSCLVTPNALVRLTAADLIGNPGNGVTPTLGIVVKLLATIPGPGVNNQANFNSSACNAAQTFTTANMAPGLVAWSTKFHANPTASPSTVLSATETLFSKQSLSQGELTKLTNLCQFLTGNQSGAGLCKGCSLGGLGAGKR